MFVINFSYILCGNGTGERSKKEGKKKKKNPHLLQNENINFYLLKQH